MKKKFALFIAVCSTILLEAQVFPGITDQHRKKLLDTGLAIPLPTYLPPGFRIDTILAFTGNNVNAAEQRLWIQYTNSLANGTYQSFYIEAGFDGLGSLWYKREKILSSIGKIYMYYQPFEVVEQGQQPQRVIDLIGTEWFNVGDTDFHVFCLLNSEEPVEQVGERDKASRTYVPLSKTEFKKVLQSLRILK